MARISVVAIRAIQHTGSSIGSNIIIQTETNIAYNTSIRIQAESAADCIGTGHTATNIAVSNINNTRISPRHALAYTYPVGGGGLLDEVPSVAESAVVVRSA